ncbi:MAG: hypothetical protein WCA44_18015 [Acidobacteriaceae bacterium]
MPATFATDRRIAQLSAAAEEYERIGSRGMAEKCRAEMEQLRSRWRPVRGGLREQKRQSGERPS